ncbi:restriction endonuclease [Leptospira wolffii]|uniref:Restriction endonuclease n=1 Tax=Leptospira wolffii TaxID=409998 RepID=A0ABV5BWB6_9LEPT
MNSFILRINPGYQNKLLSNLDENRISIGWSSARELLNNPNSTWEDFREIVHQEYYSERDNYRASGNASSSLWNFIREMNIDDIVLIPSGNSTFYIAKIIGNIEYLENKVEDDTAFSRRVVYLNDKNPVIRDLARAATISRLKVYQTCVNASDLTEEILDLLRELESGKVNNFEEEIRRRIVATILKELREGKIDNFGFERLLKNLFIKLGAVNSEIVPRRNDKGSDLIVEFVIAGILPIAVSIQAKHWNDSNPVSKDEITQLLNGMDSDLTQFGIFITSGIYSEETIKYVDETINKEKPKLYLIDGLQLANMIFAESVFSSY